MTEESENKRCSGHDVRERVVKAVAMVFGVPRMHPQLLVSKPAKNDVEVRQERNAHAESDVLPLKRHIEGPPREVDHKRAKRHIQKHVTPLLVEIYSYINNKNTQMSRKF